MFAVQIAKTLGADVTGVCSTSSVELIRSPADHVIDYASAGQPRPVATGASGVPGVGAMPPGSAGPWSSRNGG